MECSLHSLGVITNPLQVLIMQLSSPYAPLIALQKQKFKCVVFQSRTNEKRRRTKSPGEVISLSYELVILDGLY